MGGVSESGFWNTVSRDWEQVLPAPAARPATHENLQGDANPIALAADPRGRTLMNADKAIECNPKSKSQRSSASVRVGQRLNDVSIPGFFVCFRNSRFNRLRCDVWRVQREK
jgi:hypothetical protein